MTIRKPINCVCQQMFCNLGPAISDSQVTGCQQAWEYDNSCLLQVWVAVFKTFQKFLKVLTASSTQVLAATAVAASAINIGGGFTITQRMLDMFKRPGDPEEHNYLYAIPGGALMAGAAVGHFAGEAACCVHAHSQQLPPGRQHPQKIRQVCRGHAASKHVNAGPNDADEGVQLRLEYPCICHAFK